MVSAGNTGALMATAATMPAQWLGDSRQDLKIIYVRLMSRRAPSRAIVQFLSYIPAMKYKDPGKHQPNSVSMRLPKSKGGEATLGAVYARYCRWCENEKLAALDVRAFGEEIKGISRRYALRTRTKNGRVYCIDVKLAAWGIRHDGGRQEFDSDRAIAGFEDLRGCHSRRRPRPALHQPKLFRSRYAQPLPSRH
jgi:hypothetical protein